MGEMTFGNNTLRKVNFKNILSFGDKGLGEDGSGLEMKPLNVLIGANGSGKSNFLSCLEALSIVPHSTRDYDEFFQIRGGINSWIHGGSKSRAVTENLLLQSNIEVDGRVVVHNLRLAGEPALTQSPDSFNHADDMSQELKEMEEKNSVDSRHILGFYSAIRVYPSFVFSATTDARKPSSNTFELNYLLPDFSNIWYFSRRFIDDPESHEQLDNLLSRFLGYRVSLQVTSVHDWNIAYLDTPSCTMPSTRLSDGTLRFLCLCLILLASHSCSVICLEEPELGMHPDIIPTIAELLKEASQRTQLIVTTHSEILLDCLSDNPESIVICERGEDGTQMKRLAKPELDTWLKEYSLGQLWSKGVLGGNRW